jgi:hypothetical protein
LRRHHPEIQARNGAVLAVSFEPRDRLFQLSRQMGLPFPLLSDPERDAYQAYRLGRKSLRKVFGLGTIWSYIKLVVRGRRYRFQWSDLRQGGGDFVIDGQGVVRFEYRGPAPHDRPTIEKLLDVLKQI